MWKARLCQKTSLRSVGKETLRQSPFGIGSIAPSPLELPAGQITIPAPGNWLMAALRFGVLRIVTRPAAWLVEVMTGLLQLGSCGWVGSCCGVHPGGGTAASGAPSVLNSTPAVA